MMIEEIFGKFKKLIDDTPEQDFRIGNEKGIDLNAGQKEEKKKGCC